jgi:hypothetical protein
MSLSHSARFIRSSQMKNVQVAPVLLQVFRYQTPVAVMGLVLATEQTALGDCLLGDMLFNPPLAHEVKKAKLGKSPTTLKIFGDKDGTFHNFGSYEFVIKAYLNSDSVFTRCSVKMVASSRS